MNKKITTFLFLFVVLTSGVAANLDSLYIVGDGVMKTGWDGTRKEMTRLNDGSFEYTAQFYKSGTNGFKFCKTSNINDWDCLHPISSDWYVNIDRNKTYDLTDDDARDVKLQIPANGWYTIHVSADGKKMSTYPVYIYPVGSGCEVGWSLDGAVKFTETSFASGQYVGQLQLMNKYSDGTQYVKFMYSQDPNWTVYVGCAVDQDGKHDITGVGVFDTRFYTTEDHKLWAAASGFGSYNMRLDVKMNQLYVTSTNPLSFSFRFTNLASCAWRSEDVVMAYTMSYRAVGATSDTMLTQYQLLTADSAGVYRGMVYPMSKVSLGLQSCDIATDECIYSTSNTMDGYNTSADFLVKENRGGHLLALYDAQAQPEQTEECPPMPVDTPLTDSTRCLGSYNIRYSTNSVDVGYRKWENRKSYVAQLIQQIGYHVVGLQEVTSDQYNDLVTLLPEYTLYSWGRESATDSTKGERVAIAYLTDRYTCLEKGRFFLGTDTESPTKAWDASLPRLSVWVKLQDKVTNEVFLFCSTHLDDKGVQAREESAKLICEQLLMKGDANCPMIVVGDMNAGYAEKSVYDQFAATFTDARVATIADPVGQEGTYVPSWSSRSSNKRIDYIYVRNLAVKNYILTTEDFSRGTTPSDHYPIYIKAQFKSKETPTSVAQPQSFKVSDTSARVLKVLQDGTIWIVYQGCKYNLLGQ